MRKLQKLKNKYPITGFYEVDKQLIKDQIDSRNSRIKFIKNLKNIDDNLNEEIKFHKKAIKELKEMKKEFNN